MKDTNSYSQSWRCLRGRPIQYIPAAANTAKETTRQVKDNPNLGWASQTKACEQRLKEKSSDSLKPQVSRKVASRHREIGQQKVKGGAGNKKEVGVRRSYTAG